MLSKFSVKKPYTILVGVVLVLVLGYVSLTRMTTDLLPDMSLPYALVLTMDTGATPEEVESEVSAPIEAAMATTSNIKNVSSTSYDSYSVVTLEYEQNTNMDSVLIEIQQKLDQLKGNWDDSVGTPTIMQLDPDMMPVMVAAADVKDMSQADISDYVTNQLIPSLESVEGVASVTANGAIDQEIQVNMNQKKIDKLNKKIQKKIDAQFDDAQEKINSSSSEIEDGQSKLEEGKAQLADKVGSSTTEIINNKIALSKQEDQLASQLTELQSNKKSINSTIKSLQKVYDGAVKLKSGIDQLEKLEKSLPMIRKGAVSTLLASNPGATEEQQTQAADAAVAQTLSSIEKETGLQLKTEADLTKQLGAMKEQLDGINDSLKDQSKSFRKSGIKMSSYEDIPNAISTLSKNLTQINTGIVQIQSAQKKVEEGKVSLDKALDTVNRTQISSVLKMSGTSTQLASAASQLEDGQKQLDSSKETAKTSSDLNSVLTIENLNNILTAQNFSMPAGYAGTGENKYLVRVGDKVTSKEDLQNLVLMDLGIDGIKPIRLSDVASVELKDQDVDSYSKVNGNPAVMLSIEKQTGYSTGDVTKRLQTKFKSLEKADEDLNMSILMNQGVYIDIIVQSVMENMIVGAVLAILVLIKRFKTNFGYCMFYPIECCLCDCFNVFYKHFAEYHFIVRTCSWNWYAGR